MPDPMMTPGAPAGGGPKPPPVGTTPATAPSPNKGFQAAGAQKVAVALKALQDAVPLMDAASPEGKTVLDAIKKLAGLVQPGQVSPAGEKNEIEGMAMRNAQQGQQVAQMRQAMMAGGGGGGGGGGGPPGMGAAAGG